MDCIVFVTVCKIKIHHKGCYFTYCNIVMKQKLFFSCRSVGETIENFRPILLAVTHIYQLSEY